MAMRETRLTDKSGSPKQKARLVAGPVAERMQDVDR
jgi:hypothetical protein